MRRSVFSFPFAFLGLLAAGILAPLPALPRPRTPTVIPLGALPGGTPAQPLAINQRGDISGYGSDAGFQVRALLLPKGSVIPRMLPFNNIAESWIAAGLNDKGDAAGTAFAEGPINQAIYWRWKAATPTLLPALPGGVFTEAYDVNSRGDVAGLSRRAGDSHGHAVLWDRRHRVISLPEADESIASLALTLTDGGLVVGFDRTDNGETRGLRWPTRTTSPQILGCLAGHLSCRVWGVNRRGLTIGISISESQTTRAVTWAPGATAATALTLPGGAVDSSAFGVNDRGDVVGSAEPIASAEAAIYWPMGGGAPVDLNNYVPAGSDIHLSRALAINNQRMIIAVGTLNGTNTGFVVKL